MMTSTELYKVEIINFIRSITKDNFHNGYSGLNEIILKFQKMGLSKSSTMKILKEVDSELEMDKSQEDVFLEICSRVEGFSSDSLNFKW